VNSYWTVSSRLAILLKEGSSVPRYLSLSIISIVCGLSAGCTSQQLYATGQAYQRNQCQHLPEQGERDRCLSKTNTTYDDYKRETSSGDK
jgi:hypothetical protein